MSLVFSVDRKVAKTRKRHSCIWCPEKIEEGSSAVYQSAKGDDFYAGYFHPECWAAQESVTYKQWNEWDHAYEFNSFKRGTTESLHQ